MRVGLSEKITNHTLKNILLYPLVWQDVLIFEPLETVFQRYV